MWCTNSALAAVLLVAFVPRGWTALFDGSGRCAYAVPGDWKVDGTAQSWAPLAASPDGRMTATLSWSAEPQSRHAANLRGLAHPKTIHEDTAERFWVEVPSPPPLGDFHIAITPAATGACTVEIVVTTPARDDYRGVVPVIVHTLTTIY